MHTVSASSPEKADSDSRNFGTRGGELAHSRLKIGQGELMTSLSIFAKND